MVIILLFLQASADPQEEEENCSAAKSISYEILVAFVSCLMITNGEF